MSRERWGKAWSSDLISTDILVLFCHWRWCCLTSHIPVMTDLTRTVLRSLSVKTARCVWPQLSSVCQWEITHLSLSSPHLTIRLCPFFFILKVREMIDEYQSIRVQGSIFPICHQGPLSSKQEDWDWEVTDLVRSARTDWRDFINNYFPSELVMTVMLIIITGCWLLVDDVVDVVMLFNILPVPAH